MELEDITIDDFQAYEEVRQSGVTNMLSPDVESLASISKEVHLAILEHYSELCAKWPDIRELG